MQSGSGVVIILIGLVILYLAVTGRYKCLTNLIACIGGDECTCQQSNADNTQASIVTPLPRLQPLFPR